MMFLSSRENCWGSVIPAATTVFCFISCATPQSPGEIRQQTGSDAEVTQAQVQATQPKGKSYKRTVAIGRFSNETLYGKGLFVDRNSDPLADQASDILATQLLRSRRFIVFERPDLELIEHEQRLKQSGALVGVDALIIGSITEFGRAADGQKGFLSSTKTQEARASVDLRLVDVDTGRVFFTADGSGVVTKESGEVAGFGSYSAYDRTLNDRAITAAIVDVMGEILRELESRPWKTFILETDGDTIFLAGGERQGLKPGDRLRVIRQGKTIKSRQTGLPIELPGTDIAVIEVTGLFGSDEANEGATAVVISGEVPKNKLSELYVSEVEQDATQ